MLGASCCILSPQDLASGAEQAGVDARTSGEDGRAGSMLKRRMYGDLRTGGRVGGAWPGTRRGGRGDGMDSLELESSPEHRR